MQFLFKLKLTGFSLLIHAALMVWSSVSYAASFNVLLYHHISDQTPFTTSTSPEDFSGQLDYFARLGYEIVDLQKAVEQIRSGQPLNRKSLAITFDDGFESVCNVAYPELKKRGLPFTVFLSTQPIDDNYRGFCSWQQLREMSRNGGTIANHTTEHRHLVSEALSNQPWLEQAKQDINKAQNRIRQQIGVAPKLFAYPFGEYNNQLKLWLSEQGYIAFGQQSGSIGEYSDWQALPRFNAAGNYASAKSLRYKISALPMPADYLNLPDPVISSSEQKLPVTLYPSAEINLSQLRCYFSGKPIEMEWLSDAQFVAFPPAFNRSGRHRVNCTAPHKNGFPYFWLSHQWLVVSSVED